MKSNDSTASSENATPLVYADVKIPPVVRVAERIALAGFLLYAIFAPHSIAGAEIALGLVGAGWIIRAIATRRTGIHRTSLDLPIWLFIGWTILSAIVSAEPRISLPKLQAVCVVFLFYLTQSFLTRRTAIFVAALMIVSAISGVAVGTVDLLRGRGVMIEQLSLESPFHEFQMGEGDAVWRVGGARISSVQEIDDAIKRSATGERLAVSILIKGEHGERPGFVVTEEIKARASPSGVTSSGPTHRFRASGWTRHYETFSETLQILAQLAFGLALAHIQRRSSRLIIFLTLAAAGILAIGIALTAMRTVLIALAVGAAVIALRATRGRARLVIATAIALVLAAGALAVWRTRSSGALLLEDHSSSLRWNVARIGLSRVALHPVFGHGMDAIKSHWTEWGFPGTDMIHMHSTPLQIAFDRGVPALMLWLWIMGAGWLLAARGEKLFRDFTDASRHGVLLGATGALAGFFASSLVNYNFGDAEVALVFWWLLGTVVALSVSRK